MCLYGSLPPGTSILSSDFSALVASIALARRVAEREGFSRWVCGVASPMFLHAAASVPPPAPTLEAALYHVLAASFSGAEELAAV